MIDAYAIGISLTMTSGIMGSLAEIIKQFQAMQTEVVRVRDTIKQMTSGLVGMRTAGTEAAAAWNAAAAAMERAATAAGRAAASGIPRPGAAMNSGATR